MKKIFKITNGSIVDRDSFIIQVKTDNAGTSASNQFTLPMISGTYDVDWGDGNVDLAQTGTQTHTYSTAGTYNVSVTGGTQIDFNTADGDKLIDVKQWGTNVWTSMKFAFSGCDNISVLSATDTPDLSSVTDMEGIFNNCPNFNTNINNWDVSNVTKMKYSFSRTNNFNQPLDNWNTSNVTDMLGTFQISGFDQDISDWDVNQVSNFSNFLTSSSLSTANYDALLIAWDAQGAMSYSGTVNFGSSQYTLGGSAETARTSLIAKWGGIIDGGGV